MTILNFIDQKKLKRVIPFLFFIFLLPIFGKNTILISIDGVGKDDIKYMQIVDSLARSGIKATALKPVFPTQTLPNIYSVLSGKLPKDHGIAANFFKNKHTDEFYGYDLDDCSTKWLNEKLIWKELNQIGINTVSIDYPLQFECNSIDSPDIFIRKDSTYMQKLSEIIDKNENSFIAIHFKDADNAAHKFGNKSDEFINSLDQIDSEISKIIDLFDEEEDNFIIHSTFGTTELDTMNYIDISGFDSISNIDHINLGSMLLVYDYLTTANLSEVEKDSEFYTSYAEIPEYLNSFMNYNSPRRLLVADKGYVFTDEPSKLEQLKAVHGYDANLIEMHGFFAAFGNDLRSDYHIGSFEIQNIYDLILAINGINSENKHKIIHLIN